MEKGEEFVSMGKIISDLDAHDSLCYGGITDIDKCTYYNGYVKRQALFLCRTCQKDTGKVATTCYPCALACHEDHDIAELSTKRHYRCDCGNSNFTNPCTLMQEGEGKDSVNPGNKYNHNFSELYCHCNQEEGEESMTQCIICEDWFHESHLDVSDVSSTEQDDYLCSRCLSENIMLYAYSLCVNKKLQPIDGCLLKSCCRELSIDYDSIDFTQQKVSNLFPDHSVKSVYWSCDYRLRTICQCPKCLSLYEALSMNFLIDEEDTILYYDELASKRIEEQHKRNKELFQQMPRADAINYITGIQKIKSALGDVMKNMDGKEFTIEHAKLFEKQLNRDD